MLPLSSLFSTETSEGTPPNRDPLFRAFKISFFLHLGILGFLFLKGELIPSSLNSREYLPSLRVDLVALPNQKLNETVIPGGRPEDVSETAQKKEDGEISLKKKKARQDRMKNALAKIKSLEKIRAGEALRGNKVVRGSSSRGVVNESIQTTYYDVLLDKVRGEWELPQWLKEKGYSAKVLVRIDRRGLISSVLFLKSSGNDQFDSAVKKALQASTPFPAPPLSILPDVSRDGVVFGFPITD